MSWRTAWWTSCSLNGATYCNMPTTRKSRITFDGVIQTMENPYGPTTLFHECNKKLINICVCVSLFENTILLVYNIFMCTAYVCRYVGVCVASRIFETQLALAYDLQKLSKYYATSMQPCTDPMSTHRKRMQYACHFFGVSWRNTFIQAECLCQKAPGTSKWKLLKPRDCSPRLWRLLQGPTGRTTWTRPWWVSSGLRATPLLPGCETADSAVYLSLV